jgi:hypothetical protein
MFEDAHLEAAYEERYEIDSDDDYAYGNGYYSEADYCECGELLDRNCLGNDWCPDCEGPCPGCAS